MAAFVRHGYEVLPIETEPLRNSRLYVPAHETYRSTFGRSAGASAGYSWRFDKKVRAGATCASVHRAFDMPRYDATAPAEFFAVVSEYFFCAPHPGCTSITRRSTNNWRCSIFRTPGVDNPSRVPRRSVKTMPSPGSVMAESAHSARIWLVCCRTIHETPLLFFRVAPGGCAHCSSDLAIVFSSRLRAAVVAGYAIFSPSSASRTIRETIRRASSLSSAGTMYQGA